MNLFNLSRELMKAICSDNVPDLYKHLAVIQTCVRDVTDVTSEINTILLYTCAEGALKSLGALLSDPYARKYLDINCTDEDQDTALHLALKRYHIKVVEILLLQDDLDITMRNKFGQSALDLVCRKHIFQLLPQLTDVCRLRFSSKESRSSYEYYALVAAVESGTEETLDYLLDLGYSVNLNLDKDYGTPLHCAAESGSSQFVDRLLQSGAELEALTGSIMQTPLMKAAQCGHLHIVTKLVQAGAEIDRQTDECSTALTVACHFGHEDVAFYLIDQGSDCSISNPWGFTALYMATDSPNILRKILKEAKVNVNQRCGERLEAPLHLAAVIGLSESFELLLQAGADIDALTLYSETPLWLSLWKSHTHLLHYCLAYNCMLHNTPSNGCQVYAWRYTPLELAMGAGNLEAAYYLHLAGASFVNEYYFTDDQGSDFELYPSWVRLRPEVLEYVYNDEALCDWFGQVVCNPRSLWNCCVINIRKRMGRRDFVRRVRELPLPSKLKELVYITPVY